MDIFNNSIDMMRIVFLLGAVLALLCKKKFGVTPGGIIVPGILACILFASFSAFVITLVLSIICWLIYKYCIANYALSNRWSSLACLSVSVVLSLVVLAILQAYNLLDQETLLLSMIVPGLVTIAAKKYGFTTAATATLSVTALAAAAGWALAMLIPFQLLSVLSVRLAVFTPLTLNYPLVVLPISLLTAILVYYRFGIRGGGYLIAPFLAVIVVSAPLQALLILAGVALSYLAVMLVQKLTLMIGLERFVFSLFCGYFVVTLLDMLAIAGYIPGYRPAPLVTIIAVAVLTNDLSLQPLRASLTKGVTPSFLISYVTRLAV